MLKVSMKLYQTLVVKFDFLFFTHYAIFHIILKHGTHLLPTYLLCMHAFMPLCYHTHLFCMACNCLCMMNDLLICTNVKVKVIYLYHTYANCSLTQHYMANVLCYTCIYVSNSAWENNE